METVTLEQAIELIDAKLARANGKNGKNAPAKKKTTKKTTTAKKKKAPASKAASG